MAKSQKQVTYQNVKGYKTDQKSGVEQSYEANKGMETTPAVREPNVLLPEVTNPRILLMN